MNATNFTLQWTKSASKGKILVRCDKDGKLIHNDEVVIGQHSARNRYADQLANLGLCRDTAIQELLSISDEATKSESSQASSIHSGDEIEPDAVHRPERFLIQGANSRSVPILKQPTSRGDLAGSWVCYVKSQNDRQRIEIQGLIRVGSESIAIAPIPSDPDVMNKNGWSRKSRETWLRGEADIAAVATLQRLVSAIDHFLDFQTVLQRGTVLTLALWAFATYHYHAWSSLGYLLVNGPGNSGKSTVFRILREIVFRPFATDNTSAAAVFRTLHSLGGTLLYDEAERLRDTTSPDIQEINSMLLAGYQRGRGATRLEKVGDGFKQVNFQVFGPKALACINGVSTVLQSRCIVIHTQRAAKSSPKPKRSMDEVDWQQLRDELHVLSIEHGDDWLEIAKSRDIGKSINGRDFEVWHPVLAMAHWFESKGSEGLLAIVEEFAMQSIRENAPAKVPEADENILRVLFNSCHRRPIASEILNDCLSESKAVFQSWSPDGIGRRLKAYGLKSTSTGRRREFQHSQTDIRDVAERYGIELGD